MITLYVLLVMAVSVLGYQDLEKICHYKACFLDNPKYSNKPAPKITFLVWRNGSDLDVLKVTPNLEFLDVYDCNSDLKMIVFPPLASLMKLNISGCPFSELQKHHFENVNNLNSLALAGNSLEILPNETFHKLSDLWILHLEDNLTKDLPQGVFNPLENLYAVNLSNNHISTLPKDSFMQNVKLRRLYLRGNPLKNVSLDFPVSPEANIFELDLSNCGELKDLRLSIKVEDLHLNNSGVERLQITGSIRNIHHENSKVTRADLSGTIFHRSFVQVLCDMPSLEWLDLSNSSKSFNYSYFKLNEDGKECNFPNLRYLNLSGNKFKYVPRRLPLFGPNLTILDLSHNLLEGLSLESFGNAHKLQSLSLEGNRLKRFNYISICNGLKNLKRLAIYDNAFNATFYRNMTKYLGDNGLQLI